MPEPTDAFHDKQFAGTAGRPAQGRRWAVVGGRSAGNLAQRRFDLATTIAIAVILAGFPG
jgi:hypothetical protein